MQTLAIDTFDTWRKLARQMLARDVSPHKIIWQAMDHGQTSLFENMIADEATKPIPLSARLVGLAEVVGRHSAPDRWAFLYQLFWRATHGEKEILQKSTDPLVIRLAQWEREVRRDAYKVKAYVRFRLIEGPDEYYVAWHRTAYPVLSMVADFFKNRFSVMRWSILTPYESMHWNGEALQFGPGVPAEEAPSEDKLEDVWKAYYRATFNPARIKLKAMYAQMPKKYWATMPETQIIGDMLREAPQRVQTMLKHSEGLVTSALDFLPADRSLSSLSAAGKGCVACPLHCGTTQMVFGEGNPAARLMLVGEQPGFEEDKAGRPFIGPAGQVLNQGLKSAGLNRDELYLTNAVKHFKHWKRHDKAYHRNPDVRDINVCKPWLEAEIDAVQPQFILCLGVSAAKSLIGHGFTLKQGYGKWYDIDGRKIRVTYHPAAMLREENEFKRREMYQGFITDLMLVKRELESAA